MTSQVVQWSEALSAIAKTGLAFTENLYERERFEEILKVAAEMRASVSDEPVEDVIDAWKGEVKSGVPGYVTPKVAIGAVVINDKGHILLIQRTDSGRWLYPTGWADVGYSP